jgi:hypothetical protein
MGNQKKLNLFQEVLESANVEKTKTEPEEPTVFKINEHYDPKFCQLILNYGASGNIISGFAGDYNIPPHLFNKWRQNIPEFKQACAIASAKFSSFWGNKASKGEGAEANTAIKMLERNEIFTKELEANKEDEFDETIPLHINFDAVEYENKKFMLELEKITKMIEEFEL